MKTRHLRLLRLATALLLATGLSRPATAVLLADQPVFASSDVPGNLALALSVEFPTAISVANLGNYDHRNEYLGYFDPGKCYVYQLDSATPSASYFVSAGLADHRRCTGQWSGNFLNWAAMQTIDPFRWALGGGYRSVDTPTETVLEKAWGSQQGGANNFPNRGTGAANGHRMTGTQVNRATPFTGTNFNLRLWGRGNRMVFGSAGTDYNTLATAPDYAGQTSGTFQVYIRVKVCDPAAGGGLESNCVAYSSGYKPEGLLQQYANRIRYSTFAYLNAPGNTHQGAAMRARMNFIGPTMPMPLSLSVTANPNGEWDAGTGVMAANPDPVAAAASGVAGSGVLNYLNQFGQSSKSYMTYDTVSELYYAALRYFQNLGNVPEWTASVAPGASGRAQRLDGFPAITDWENHDPILYACQRNFILGIGDSNTHFDRNVGGSALTNSRPMPSAVAADPINQAHAWTAALESLEGLGSRNGQWGNQGSGYIAGLAYGAHVNDIRPDIDGKQTITTYWMDVMEYQVAADRNPYWLAAKYGGFRVPANYDIANTVPLTTAWWNTANEMIAMSGGNNRRRPDNYFLAGNARQMVAGLNRAFEHIANAIRSFTTAFSLSAAQVTSTGTASFASQYDSEGWTGKLSAGNVTFAPDGTPSAPIAWATDTTLEDQLAGSGWNTDRRVVTWNTVTQAGVPFRAASLATTQLAALDTQYVAGNDRQDYLNYLRGERRHEVSSTDSGSRRAYRNRPLLMGDIVNAKVTAVGPPQMIFAESLNPGYTAFKSARANRPTMIYVGANDGMLHAFNGELTGPNAGREVFAYIPGGLFQGASGNRHVDGLVALGKPNYSHRFYVDATALAFDIDLGNAGGGAGAPNWRTLLIGGLGKGGRSYHAIDVTDPATMTSEAAVASRVKWEFTHPSMGFSYGMPTVVKTRKYGWVVILTSGYRTDVTPGHLYLVHPGTGALLEQISTPIASSGLTHASAYVADFSDGTTDAVYAGDLNGRIWRFDLTATAGAYPAPTVLARATAPGGAAQPVTTAPLIEVQPQTRKRYVLFGTGRLLHPSDITSPQMQSFYAVIDGTSTAFDANITAPVERADLVAVTDLTQGATMTQATPGWYHDLGQTSSIGWRLNNHPGAHAGIVAFAPLLPIGDACSPSGTSRIYLLDFANGRTALLSGDPYHTLDSDSGTVIDIRFISVDGRARLLVGTNQGVLAGVDFQPSPSMGLRLLNWREIPTAD